MARILVTGGAGFIGSHLVERLAAREDEVVIVDNFDEYYDPAIKRMNLRGLENPPLRGQCTLIEADIRDSEAIDEIFAKHPIDVVVHLAARAGVRPSIEAPALYEEVNLKGTVVLLEACRRYEVRRFVFGSSSSVYGDSASVPFSEDARVDRPVSPYAATKVAGELLCHTYHHLFGIGIFALRFFTVYGPRQRPEMAIHKFTRCILEGTAIPRFGDGSSERDYTYIDDIMDGVLKAIDRVEGYAVYNLGESRRTSLSELIRLIEKEAGVAARVEPKPDQPGDVRSTCADITRARADLGYDPQVPIEEGVRRFVEWFKAGKSG